MRAPVPTLAWCALGCDAHSTKAVGRMATHACTARFTTLGLSSARRNDSVSAARGSKPLSRTLQVEKKVYRRSETKRVSGEGGGRRRRAKEDRGRGAGARGATRGREVKRVRPRCWTLHCRLEKGNELAPDIGRCVCLKLQHLFEEVVEQLWSLAHNQLFNLLGGWRGSTCERGASHALRVEARAMCRVATSAPA